MTTDPLSEPWRDVRQMMDTNAADTALPSTTAGRAANVGHWLRDTGLGAIGFLIVLCVAVTGWWASFIGLHDFGHTHMSLSDGEAWLVPGTFDGAPLGLSLVVFRASINGRSATVWRVLIFVFTGLSSWINWQHIDDPTGRWIASFMPPAAVLLFEGIMSEARAAASRRLGHERPRLHPLRWFIDRSGTWAIYRAYVLGISLPEHLQSAAAGDSTPPVPPASEPSPVDNSDRQDERQDERQEDRQKPPAAGDKKPTLPRRQKAAKTTANKRRSMDEWVAAAGPVFHAEFARLRRNPTADEFATAIKAARLGTVSASTAKNIRAEILDRAELPSLDGSE